MNSVPQVYPGTVLGNSSAMAQECKSAPEPTVRDALLAAIEHRKEEVKQLELLAVTLTPEQQAMTLERFRAMVYRFV